MRAWLKASLIALSVAHCVGSDALYDPPGGRGFWARKSNLSQGTSSFYRTTAMFNASSAHSIVYVENQNSVSQSAIDGIIAAFENNIVPIENVWYTQPTDVDNNGKIILLLLDIQDGYQPGGSYIAGYFDPYNDYTDAAVNATNSSYHSNHADMLYLDTYPADPTQISFFATMGHEYQHLLQFGKYFRGEQSETEPTWVDEGLAEVTADLVGFGPQVGRAQNFGAALRDLTSLTRPSGPFLLDNYAASYTYFRYIADVYGIGGIAAVFHNHITDVAGVDSALAGVDTALVANCGTTTSLVYPAFGCSYRFLWGALIKGSLGTSPAGATIHYNGLADSTLVQSGAYDYALKPATSNYSVQLATSLVQGAYTAVSGTSPTITLAQYTPKLYHINTPPPVPALNCTECGLTMVVGAANYVVFNHNAASTGSASGTVTDDILPMGPVVAEPATAAETAPLRKSGGVRPQDSQKSFWHIPFEHRHRKFIQHLSK